MEQLFFIAIATIIILFSFVGGAVRAVIRKIRAKRRAARAEAARLEAEGTGTIGRTGPSSFAPAGASRPGESDEQASEAHRGSGKHWSDMVTEVPVSKRSSGLERVRSLPPLKRAILWSEILSRPVSERPGHRWD